MEHFPLFEIAHIPTAPSPTGWSFIHSFTFIHSSIHPFIHTFIHSFMYHIHRVFNNPGPLWLSGITLFFKNYFNISKTWYTMHGIENQSLVLNEINTLFKIRVYRKLRRLQCPSRCVSPALSSSSSSSSSLSSSS